MLINRTPAFVKTKSINSLDKASCCRSNIALSHRVSKCPLIPVQLCLKFTKNPKKTWKALPIWKPQPHGPKYGHSSTSLPTMLFLTPNTNYSSTAYAHSPKVKTESESLVRVTTKNRSQRIRWIPGLIPWKMWTLAHKMECRRYKIKDNEVPNDTRG